MSAEIIDLQRADLQSEASPLQLSGFLDAGTCAEVIDQLGIVSVTDTKGRILYVNDEFVRLSKYSREELIGENHRILKSGHHPPQFFREMYRTISGGRMWRSPIKNRAKDGTFYWVDALIIPIKNAGGRVTNYVSVRLDITEAVGLHIEMQEKEELLKAILDNFPGGIAVYDKELQMRACNRQFQELLEYPRCLFSGKLPSLEDLLRFNAARGEYGDEDAETTVGKRVALARQNIAHNYERSRPNGTFLEVRGAPLAGGGFVSTHLDITDRKHDQEMIEKLAQHDALTGLGNRRLLRDRMQSALARVERGDKLALLYLDLDRFKAVNDTLGHPIGDLLLQEVAKRLTSETRAMDTVVRLGGDEFAVLQPGTNANSDASDLAERLIAVVSAPYSIKGNSITIGTSVGIALAPNDTSDPDALLKCADLALYQVKKSGRGTFRYFEQEMDERMRARHQIESGLRKALERGELELHYQPIVETTGRRIVSCEALLRWYHRERGLVSASEFIPVAEETGLIVPIGDWILREACREAKRWPGDVTVSVNVSAAQLRHRDFEGLVADALDGLAPSRLVIEITESTLMQRDHETHQMLQRIRNSGVRFALDDFGTGYSSLSYLQRFPFDKIKIDRSFISATFESERSRTLLSAIAGLGRSLDMSTVAEGIETQEQFEYVRQQGCTEAQGYLVSDALTTAQLAARLKGPQAGASAKRGTRP